MILAGIDVGTNAVKGCTLAVDGSVARVTREWRVASRLGEGWLAGGRLRPGPMARTCSAVAHIADEARSEGAAVIRVGGTSACREAENTNELADCILDRCGLPLEVLSGPDECRLSFLAVARLEGAAGPMIVCDTGGGSTEWAIGEDGRLLEAVSVPVGAVRCTEAFLSGNPPSRHDIDAAVEHIVGALAVLPRRHGARLVATGGTAHTIAQVYAEAARLDEQSARAISRAELDRQVLLYTRLRVSERAEIPGMEPARADIILAGALILRECIRIAGVEMMGITDAGVRHGLALEAG